MRPEPLVRLHGTPSQTALEGGRPHPSSARDATASSAIPTSISNIPISSNSIEPTARPASCTVTWINYAGLAALIVATYFVVHSNLPIHLALLVVLAAPAIPIIVLEAFFIRTRIPFRPLDPRGCYPQRQSGLPTRDRILLKLAGLTVSIAALAFAYWLFPIYRNGDAQYLLMLVQTLWLPLVALTPIYVWFIDKRLEAPEDGYFHVGLVSIGAWRLVDWDLVRQHGLQWLVKGFFLPMMLVFCVTKIRWMGEYPIGGALSAFLSNPTADNWIRVYEFLYVYMLFIDVTFACVGYVLTLKLFDAHLRTAEPTAFGWFVCLVCYPPFWNVFAAQYFGYDDNLNWGYWLADWPTLKVIWSFLILFLMAVYALATVQFGIRFSNLTHRGILTNGPYRWLKHPARNVPIAVEIGRQASIASGH